MNQELFRQEAIDHQRERLMGEVVLTQPLSTKVWVSCLVATALVAILLLIFGTFTRKERVQGYLVPAGGLVEVYPQRTGTVVSTLIEAGDFVTAGQPVIEITSHWALTDGANVNAALVGSLQSQRELMLSQIDRLHQRRDKQRVYLESRILNTRAQTEQILDQIKIQQEHSDLVKKRHRALLQMREQKLIAEEEYQQRFERFLVEQKSLKQMEQSLLQAEALLRESELELALLDDETQTQVDELQSQVASLEQRILQQKGEHSFVVTAPASGRVASLQAYEGQRVDSTQPIMAILPEDVAMEAELFIPTRAIGFVQPGLSVEIRYDPFPYERFGVYPGTVERVAKTVLTPSQLDVPLAINEPVYRARLKLGHADVNAYGREYPLQAGMRLEAAIMLDERPLYQWLFQPLYSIKGAI